MSSHWLLPLLAQEADQAGGLPMPLLVAVIVAVLVLPFVVGTWLARRWRVPEYTWKVNVILFALTLGIAVNALGRPELGIDLSGGFKLIYQVSPEELEKKQDIDMDAIVGAVSERVNPGGISDIVVRPYGSHQVEIIVPRQDQNALERVKYKITNIGQLEFRILADRKVPEHQAVIAAAEKSSGLDVYVGGRRAGQWVPISRSYLPDFLNRNDLPNLVTRKVSEDSEDLETLVVVGSPDEEVTGEFLVQAMRGIDRTSGGPIVEFQFNALGARRFGALTRANLPDPNTGYPRHLAILLDNEIRSAPAIQDVITDRGQITGRFTAEEVRDLVQVLNAGRLPASLEKRPTYEMSMGPQLGEDTIRAATISMGGSLLLVLGFMVFYYRMAGLVACFALVLNLLMVVALMILVHASFTLPGLAGLVLTVGMSVDANVLIFERIREELQRGAALRMAIRNGFDRAFSAIFDSSLTTLITAVVLYIIGTDQVKGFAVTLFLGIVMSLFTGVFCSRAIFEIADRRRWIGSLKMRQMIGQTSFDFLKLRWPAIAVSVVLIAAGLLGVYSRGTKSLFDIDFTGGVTVTMQFEQPQEIGQVRSKASMVLPDVTISSVSDTASNEGLLFVVNTSEEDEDKVTQELVKAFPGMLKSNHASVLAVGPYVPDAPPAASDNPAKEGQEPTGSESPDNASESAPENPSESAPGSADEPPKEPADNQGALRRDLPDASLLAQADEAPEESPDKPAAEAPAAPTKDAPTKEAPAEKTPADEPPAADAPAKEPPASETPAEDTPAEDTAAEEPSAPDGDDAAAGADAGVPRSRIDLEFSDPISASALESTIRQAIEARLSGVVDPDIRLVLRSPDPTWRIGSETPLTRWNLVVDLPQATAQRLGQAITEEFAASPYFPAVAKIGGQVAAETRSVALSGTLASLLFIIGYLWFRFQKVSYGLAATVAAVHDVLITLAFIALSLWLAPYLGFLKVEPFKINLAIIAAFLTIIGYSLNDTIVIFDRIREVRGKNPQLSPQMVNLSINQTLSRTLLTTLTTLAVVAVLYWWGGQGIHGFAFALVVGMVAGTYSTVFIAAPVLLWLSKASPVSVPVPAGSQRVTEATGIG